MLASPLTSSTLILMITYRCNLDCSYCQIKKQSGKEMTLETAHKAVDLFLKADLENNTKKTIKIFGGEPLLRYNFLTDLISYSINKNKNHNYYITSNGTMLNRDKIAWLQNNPVQLVVSLDGDRHTQNMNRVLRYDAMPFDAYDTIKKYRQELKDNTIVNMVIAPNTVHDFYRNLQHIMKLGFKKINFLPGYYLKWSESELNVLRKQLSLVIPWLVFKERLYIKNFEINNVTPFFNNDIFVDYNGDMFLNNMFLSELFETKREQLKVGNIHDYNSLQEVNWPQLDYNKMLDELYDQDIISSTRAVDQIFTNFLEKLIKLDTKGWYVWPN